MIASSDGNCPPDGRAMEAGGSARVEAAPAVDHVVLEAALPTDLEVPTRVLIAPWGEVKSVSGSFVVDDEAAEAALAAFREHSADLPVDYEHQTLGGAYASPNGQAPAAGWIRALAVVRPGADLPPGIYGEVSWTPDGLARLRGREYRYLSPVALVRRSDRRLTALHSVALTNKPAIVGMTPVVNRANLAAPSSAPAETAAELCGLLGLHAETSTEAVLAGALARLRFAEDERGQRQAEDRVALALSAGKLTAAQQDWAVAFARRDPQGFDQWAAGAPVVVVAGRMVMPGAAPSASVKRQATEAAARAEYQAHRGLLEKLCTESAYVAAALRDGE